MCISTSKGYESYKRKQIFEDINTAESFNDYARREMHVEFNIYDLMQLLKHCNARNKYGYIKRNLNRLTPIPLMGTINN